MTTDAEFLAKIAKRLSTASRGDRMYEKPMSWDEADRLLALVPGNRGETGAAHDNALAAAARNDALEAAALTCRDVGAVDAERLIRSMLRTVAPPASAYGVAALASPLLSGEQVEVDAAILAFAEASYNLGRSHKFAQQGERDACEIADKNLRVVIAALSPAVVKEPGE